MTVTMFRMRLENLLDQRHELIDWRTESTGGHTLKESLEQAARLTGVAVREAYVDRGFRGHGLEWQTLKVWIAGAKRGVTVAIRKKLKRRNAVEPVIGHMKTDGRLGRNFLKGWTGMP